MTPDWKNHGLRIVRSGQLDTNTPQTPGMTRAEAISHAKVGAHKLWAGGTDASKLSVNKSACATGGGDGDRAGTGTWAGLAL